MPFTFSHPAAILPVYKWTRRKDLLLPLSIGAMMPDFGYYFAPLPVFNENAHTFIKSFTFCLPVGLLVLALILFLKDGFLSILPDNKSRSFFYDHLPGNLNLKFFVLAAIAIILGSWTHIVWDSFTHRNGMMVNEIPFLSFEILNGVSVFRILQHVSTLAGAYYLFRFYHHFPVTSGAWNKRSLIFITIVNVLALLAAFTVQPFQWFFFITKFIKMFVLMVISAAAVNSWSRRTTK